MSFDLFSFPVRKDTTSGGSLKLNCCARSSGDLGGLPILDMISLLLLENNSSLYHIIDYFCIYFMIDVVYIVIDQEFVIIKGDDAGMILTTNMRSIIDDLASKLDLDSMRVFYRDCFGYVDEVVLIDGKFSHFRELKKERAS